MDERRRLQSMPEMNRPAAVRNGRHHNIIREVETTDY